MRAPSRLVAVVLILSTSSFVACGGGGGSGAATGNGSTAKQGDPLNNTKIAITPMKLVGGKPGEPPQTVMDLRADGTIWGPGGKEVAQVAGDRIVSIAGKTIMVLDADGSVSIPEANRSARFDENDVLTSKEGKGVGVGDDGVPFFFGADKKVEKFPGYWDGYKPTARRTAVMLTVLLLIAVKIHKEAADAASGAPTTNGAPPNP